MRFAAIIILIDARRAAGDSGIAPCLPPLPICRYERYTLTLMRHCDIAAMPPYVVTLLPPCHTRYLAAVVIIVDMRGERYRWHVGAAIDALRYADMR